MIVYVTVFSLFSLLEGNERTTHLRPFGKSITEQAFQSRHIKDETQIIISPQTSS